MSSQEEIIYQMVNGIRYELEDDDDDHYQVINGVRYELEDDDDDHYQVINGVRYELEDGDDDHYQIINGVRYELEDGDDDHYQVINGIRYELEDGDDDHYQVINGVRYELEDGGDDHYQVINGIRYELDQGYLLSERNEYLLNSNEGGLGHLHDSDHENEGGYSVVLNESGEFVGLYEYYDDGSLENETESDSIYVFDEVNGLLYETEIEDHGVERSIYSDSDGDGIYEKISSEYSLSEGETESDFVLTGAFGVEGSDNDDWILMSDFVESEGGAGADSFIMRDLTESTIRDFNVYEGDKIVFDTGYGLSNVDDLAQYVSEIAYDSATQTLVVDFSGYASLEIVGIANYQISWDIVEILS